jgi:hypothetical protein
MQKQKTSSLLHNLPFKLRNSRAVVSFLGRRGRTLENFGHERSNLSPDLAAEGGAHLATGADLAAGSVETVITRPAPDNPDPEKNVVPVIRPLKGLRRFIVHLYHLPGKILADARPAPDEEEIARKIRLKEDEDFLATKKPDLQEFAHRVIGRMTRLNFMNVETTTESGKKRRIHTVRPDMVVVDRLGTKYTMSLDIANLPFGVKLTDLVQEETMSELLPAVGMKIKGELDVAGVRIIGYPSGQLGLPEFISVNDLWEAAPKAQPMLSFPVGIGENGHKHYKDLVDCPHLLIVGGSMQGKSNMINVIISTYLRSLRPEQVKFVLFDLKGGMEFNLYEGIPHLLIDLEHDIPGIVERIEQSLPAMEGLTAIMEQRIYQIKNAGLKNISEYNAKRQVKNRMPIIIVVFDEYGKIGLKYGEKADNLIADLSNMARAAGIHIIIGSQYPRADILTTLATINFQVRIAFNMTGPASTAMIGNQAAAGMVCRGRAILNDYDKQDEIQTPRITDSTIRAIVDDAIAGKISTDEKFNKVDIEEVLEVSLKYLEGSLEIRKLYPLMRTKITKASLIKMLKGADNQTYQINDTKYLVTTSQGRSRKILLADNPQIPTL